MLSLRKRNRQRGGTETTPEAEKVPLFPQLSQDGGKHNTDLGELSDGGADKKKLKKFPGSSLRPVATAPPLDSSLLDFSDLPDLDQPSGDEITPGQLDEVDSDNEDEESEDEEADKIAEALDGCNQACMSATDAGETTSVSKVSSAVPRSHRNQVCERKACVAKGSGAVSQTAQKPAGNSASSGVLRCASCNRSIDEVAILCYSPSMISVLFLFY